jgi:nucleoside diphosphate kinase
MGRAVREKCLDTLLRLPSEALREVHIVIIASVYSKNGISEPENISVINELKKLLPSNATLICDYNRDLALTLMTWKNTKALVVSSSSEPLGMLGLEFRAGSYLSDNGAILIVANTAGLTDQVIHQITGFIYKDISNLEEILKQVIRANDVQLKEIQKNSFENLIKNFSVEKNLYSLLQAILPDIFTPSGKPLTALKSKIERGHLIIKPDGYKQHIIDSVLSEIKDFDLEFRVLGKFKLNEVQILEWGSFINGLPDKEQIIDYLTNDFLILIETNGIQAIDKSIRIKHIIRRKFNATTFENLIHCPNDFNDVLRERNLFDSLISPI